jgi:hypothetical protein
MVVTQSEGKDYRELFLNSGAGVAVVGPEETGGQRRQP